MASNYKNKFILYFKTKNILTLCKKYNIDVKNILIKNTYEKVGDLISSIAINYIHKHNNLLTCTKILHNIYTDYNHNVVYSIIQTNPNVNHPYMCFADIHNNYIGLILPFGNDTHQIPTEFLNYSQEQNELTKFEYTMLYIKFNYSIRLRIDNILQDGYYSLVKCSNITHCLKKKDIIMNSKKLSKKEKNKYIDKISEYYKRKAVKMLTKYFSLLAAQDYTDARAFLKGGYNKKYYNKERLDTFFKSNKGIIGHLEVFINLYKKKIELYNGSSI